MAASKLIAACSACILASEYAIILQTSTSYLYTCICALAFSAGLNGLQVDKVNKENNSRSSRKTLLVASKLIAACNARMCAIKPKKCPTDNVVFVALVHALPLTRKGKISSSRTVSIIFTHTP